jgi:isoamylase
MTRTTPLGPVREGTGFRFSVYSRHAEGMTLSLFDERGIEQQVAMERAGDLFTVYIPGVTFGQRYGFRAEGPYDAPRGLRFCPAKLLLDPYARKVEGAFVPRGELFDFHPTDACIDRRDTAAHVPRSVVVDPTFDWGDDTAPRTPWSRTVVYEAHVKGFTRLHPLVPEAHRGTFLGLCHDEVLDHLVGLGVTAIELMPIQQGVLERHLAAKRLPNYWGYNTIAPFAPDSRFAVADPVVELKQAVKRLHQRGLEVILDIVLNHTGEGDELGTTVGLRGLDGPTYYRRTGTTLTDWTGTGNTLNLGDPAVRRWALDCLRAWVVDYHIDGFRFDLGVCLGREAGPFSPQAELLRDLVADPVLGAVKRIVEPWDLGPDGYQLGQFPPGYVEWNGEYRDTVRRFFRGDPGMVGTLATRVCGSSDRYGTLRGPLASVSFVTAHDGYTLRDLVSYEQKHNEANGEQNRDGHEPNYSRNFGEEGDTEDPTIRARRLRTAKSLIVTLAMSQGVPMLLGGDEFLRTQQGNNNAYCQDHPGVYTKWDSKAPEVVGFTAFVREAFALRRGNPSLGRSTFFSGEKQPDGSPDVAFYTPAGAPMVGRDWSDEDLRSFVFTMADPDGEWLVLLHAGEEPQTFVLPARPTPFELRLDSQHAPGHPASSPVEGHVTLLPGGSLVFRRPTAHPSSGPAPTS